MPRGDGKLRIAFVQIGQGDCIVVACPNGKVALIDCGTNRWEGTNVKEVQFQLFCEDFLHNYNKLDLLILTHADKDHYNQLKKVLGEQVAIQQFYYGGDLLTYEKNGVGAWLKLTANVPNDKQFAFTQNEASQTKKLKKLVLDGGDKCKIYLLAGNVAWKSIADGSDVKNAGSLVTLIEFGDTSILLCADATRATEEFLITHFKKEIEDVTILQVPHHGSETTSSHHKFVETVNPEIAVICAGVRTSSYKLPRYSVIKRYAEGKRIADFAEHELCCWSRKHEAGEKAPQAQGGKKRKEEGEESERPIKRRKLGKGEDTTLPNVEKDLQDAESKFESLIIPFKKHIQTTGSKARQEQIKKSDMSGTLEMEIELT